MSTKILEIMVIQNNPRWNNPRKNLQILKEQLQKDVPPRASLLVLPEMFSTGFDVSGSCDGVSGGSLQEISDTYGCNIIAGLSSLRDPAAEGRRQNLAVIFRPEKPCHHYSKIQLFRPGGEGEQFCAGEELLLFPCKPFVACPLICYDLRFPELFRKATLAGAELFVLIANWPSQRHEHWLPLLKARAIENQAWVLGVNRAGSDPQNEYLGESVLFDPVGEQIALAGSDEELLRCKADYRSLSHWRRDYPNLEDVNEGFLGKKPTLRVIQT